jgi:hypothetical protein
MTDEQLLEEYNKEIHGQYAYLTKKGEMTVARLIESHRYLRNLNIERNGVFDEARKEGYKQGYEWGIKTVEANAIQYEDLRKMTIQELANFIGTDDD